MIGAPPPVFYTAPARIPFSVSELDVAGGLAGAPIEVVKCITNDVLVPANAEIVIEGKISTEFLEPEAPFGESTGYIAERFSTPISKSRRSRTEKILSSRRSSARCRRANRA